VLLLEGKKTKKSRIYFGKRKKRLGRRKERRSDAGHEKGCIFITSRGVGGRKKEVVHRQRISRDTMGGKNGVIFLFRVRASRSIKEK